MVPPIDTTTAVRREWFLEFAHWYKQEFASAFSLTTYADWQPGVSEPEWRAFARDSEGGEVSASLPHNFPWFRPLPVARSVVVRLLDQIAQREEKAKAPVETLRAAPRPGRRPPP